VHPAISATLSQSPRLASVFICSQVFIGSFPVSVTIIRYNGQLSKKVENYFSHNLKILRKRSGLSLVALAAKIGCGKSVLGQYEHGKSKPSMSNLIEISRYFGITVSDLTEKRLDDRVITKYPELDEVDPVSLRVAEASDKLYKASRSQALLQKSIDQLMKDYKPDQLAKIAHDLLVENKALMDAFESLGKGLKSK